MLCQEITTIDVLLEDHTSAESSKDDFDFVQKRGKEKANSIDVRQQQCESFEFYLSLYKGWRDTILEQIHRSIF